MNYLRIITAFQFLNIVSIHLYCNLPLTTSDDSKHYESAKIVVNEQVDQHNAIRCSCANYSALCKEKPGLRLCSGEVFRAIRLVDDYFRIYTSKRPAFDEISLQDNIETDDEAIIKTVGNDSLNKVIVWTIFGVITCFALGVIGIRRGIKNGYFDRFSVNAQSNASNT